MLYVEVYAGGVSGLLKQEPVHRFKLTFSEIMRHKSNNTGRQIRKKLVFVFGDARIRNDNVAVYAVRSAGGARCSDKAPLLRLS